MPLGALIVACGTVSGGEIANPTAMVGSVSVAARMVETFRQIDVERIVVVYCAKRFPTLTKQIAKTGAICLDCGEMPLEMFACVKIGVRYLEQKCSRLFLSTVDTPLFTVDTLQALLCAKEEIVNPVYQNRTGHPLLLAQTMFAPLLAYDGTDGLRGFLAASAEKRGFATVDDGGILCNLKTAEDVKSAVDAYDKRSLHVAVRLRLVKERPFFGPGAAQLLSLIAETKSVSVACQQMGISYSKGWKILSTMEEQTGRVLTVRQQGGKNGGTAYLTQDGAELLSTFRLFEERCNVYIKREFDALFSKW
ncbi:MAG: NTP transferase domain-containing protein [Ruthenibacterium sp.]